MKHLSSEHQTALQRGSSFSQVISSIDPADHLAFCEELFRYNVDCQQKLEESTYDAWKHIVDHRLWDRVDKTRRSYWNYLESTYHISSSINNHRRAELVTKKLETTWKVDIGQILPDLVPARPSRHLLEALNKFAKQCPNLDDAKSHLEQAMGERPMNSRPDCHVIPSDIERALQTLKQQQKPLPQKPSNTKKPKNQTSKAQNSGKRKRDQELSHPNEPNLPSPVSMLSPSPSPSNDSQPQRPLDFNPDGLIDATVSSLPYPNDPTKYPVPMSFLRQKLYDLIAQLHAPKNTWGDLRSVLGLSYVYNSRPARVWTPRQESGFLSNGYEFTPKEQADVFVISEKDAVEELRKGPPGGQRVIIRGKKDSSPQHKDNILAYIETYQVEDVAVQDPLRHKKSSSFRSMPPTELKELLSKSRWPVGFQDGQVPPYNWLNFPSLRPETPPCLSTDETRLLYLIRSLNRPSEQLQADNPWWRLLSFHLAITPFHQDHDGCGTFFRQIAGYKVIFFCSPDDDVERINILENAMPLEGKDIRYVVIGPYDQYIQTPVKMPDIHAVINVGYCGVIECTDDCIRWGHPKCTGLITAEGMHYWHAHFMAHSVRAAKNELKDKHITNQDPHPYFLQTMRYIEISMGRNEEEYGGHDACEEFRRELKEYAALVEDSW